MSRDRRTCGGRRDGGGSRVDRDAASLLRAGRPGPAMAVAAAARLVADAWRVQAALEAAAWGRPGLEIFDAVA